MARGRNAGNKGQGSKWISRTRRRKIYDRDGWKCVWCGVEVCCVPACEDHGCATLDHVLARSDGGSNTTNNLVTACMRCNRLRGNQHWHPFVAELVRTLITTVDRTTGVTGVLRGSELRRLTAPIRKRIRTILNTNWGF